MSQTGARFAFQQNGPLESSVQGAGDVKAFFELKNQLVPGPSNQESVDRLAYRFKQLSEKPSSSDISGRPLTSDNQKNPAA